MKESNQNKPSSFAQTVQLVENYARQEIIKETKARQLYYHTLDHTLAVKRRANIIFRSIEPVLPASQFPVESDRLLKLIDICAMAHDLVQQFDDTSETQTSRKRTPGVSEIASVDKLIQYIQQLNQTIASHNLDASVGFSDRDIAIIKDGILATICQGDPLAGKANYSFSPYSIYQPYLYNDKPSIVGTIIALADLGTLGMEGVEQFVHEGVLVFLEDNLDLKNLIVHCDCPTSAQNAIKARLLNMARFMVSLAQERQARFELEISSFTPQARQILRSQVFIYFNDDIDKIKTIVPTDENTSLTELIDFFCLKKNLKT